jgi:hypothetical protein
MFREAALRRGGRLDPPSRGRARFGDLSGTLAALRRWRIESTREASMIGRALTPAEAREHSLSVMRARGLRLPPAHFPLRERTNIRPEGEVVRRALALNALVHIHHGAPRDEVRAWAHDHGLLDGLTKRETAYWNGDDADKAEMSWRVEALYVLAWALGLNARLDPWSTYDPATADWFPRPLRDYDTSAFASRYALRSPDKIFAEADLDSCLDWLVVEQGLGRVRALPEAVATTIHARRHSLEWLTSDETWDAAPMDT